jgi:NADPH-dependent ferric siderophore reductase
MVAEVIRTEPLSRSMLRVVLGGDGLRGFTPSPFADSYVKLLFPPDDQPRRRTYTVRSWDPATRQLSIDVLLHGDAGLAGRWAARARPGDRILLLGPGGAYAPDPRSGWHLFVGDESALPAIAVALERLGPDTVARVFLEVDGPDDELPLAAPPAVLTTWVHRGARPAGEALLTAVEAAEFPDLPVDAFVHGEAGVVRRLRRHLLGVRGVPREQLSISGYWRLGVDDEGWRALKRDWNRDVEAEEHSVPAG